MKCFRLNCKKFEPESYQKADLEELVADKEDLLCDIIDETPRANESIVAEALDLAYDGQKKDVLKEVARKICACVQFVRQKGQSSSSCKKLSPAVARLVQKHRERYQDRPKRMLSTGSTPPPSAKKHHRDAFAHDEDAAQSSSAAAIFAAYGLQDPELVASDCDLVSIEESDAENTCPDTSAPSSRSRPYFDGKNYVRACADGSVEKASMVAGPTGFCLVQFGSEQAFKSEVPNVYLEENKPKKKAKAKAKPAVHDDRDGEGKMDDGAEDPAVHPVPISAEDIDARDDECVHVDSADDAESDLQEESADEGETGPLDAETKKWHGYSLEGLPQEAWPNPEIHKGKHSWCIHLENEQGVIDVLMRNRAFWIKKPLRAKGQHSWSKYSSVAEAWEAAKAACRNVLKRTAAAVKLLS